MKIFKIEDCYNFMGLKRDRLPIGTLVVSTDEYSGGHDISGARIVGYVSNPKYQVSEALESTGFTEHEVYLIELPSGESTVAWPQEIEPLDGGNQ